jgi:hypothetical protein
MAARQTLPLGKPSSGAPSAKIEIIMGIFSSLGESSAQHIQCRKYYTKALFMEDTLIR